MGKNRIKQPHSLSRGSKISVDSITIENLKYPVFCFKHVHKDHGIGNCTDDEKKSLLEKIFQLSQMDWQLIEYSPRHGSGTEKIKRSSLKVNPPTFITEDVDYLLALRFDGLKHPIHRN